MAKLLCWLPLCAASLAPLAQAAPHYHVQNLGDTSVITGIQAMNNVGQIVGKGYTPFEGWRSYLWENNKWNRLPDPWGDQSYSFMGNDINDSGVIGGTVMGPNFETSPVIYKNGQLIPQPLKLPYERGGIKAINSHGVAAGEGSLQSPFGGFDSVAVTYANGELVRLQPDKTTAAWADDVNDNGTVVGKLFEYNAKESGFIYKDGVLSELRYADKATTLAQVNNQEVIAGTFYDDSGKRTAFLYHDGQYTVLDALGASYCQFSAYWRHPFSA